MKNLDKNCQNFRLIFSLLLTILPALISCAGAPQASPGLDVEFIPVTSIGQENADSSYYSFNRIDDIHVDDQMRIYICEYFDQAVYVYDSTGVFLHRIIAGRGQGPGECIGARQVRTTQDGQIAVLDHKQNKILFFSMDGKFLKDLLIKNMNPAKMEFLENSVLVSGRFHIYPGGIIHEYDLGTGEFMRSFGARSSDSVAVSQGGYWDFMDSKNGQVFLSHSYPYRIDCFDQERKLTNSFTRAITFNKPPRPIKINGIECYGVTFAPVAFRILPDGKILSIIAHYEDDAYKVDNISKKVHFYCDFFSSKGEHLLTVPIPSRGITNKWLRWVTTDKQGNLYMDYGEPYPHVVKYKMKFKKLG